MKALIIIAGLLGFLLIIPGSVSAQSCTAPAQVTGVLVEYPEDDGETASFTQASCSWNAVSGATSYTYTITEVDTGTVVDTNSVNASTLRVVFPVTQERTYKCDVNAVNSCGASGLVGTHQLLCTVDGLIDTPTPTPIPATPTPLPTKPPPIESPGAFENTAIILGGLTLVIVGGLALILL